ncbi:MAG: GAF domain-containing protein [Longicatena sp.]
MNEKIKIYEALLQQLDALLYEEHDEIANMANAAALLYHTLPNINWAGFYLCKNDELILGPFQGSVACMHIPLGKGVCGTCAKTLQLLRVDNVHEFATHIACDSASKSEIVLPLIQKDTLIGVLDIDSPNYQNFDEQDEIFLQLFVDHFLQSLCM